MAFYVRFFSLLVVVFMWFFCGLCFVLLFLVVVVGRLCAGCFLVDFEFLFYVWVFLFEFLIASVVWG